VSRRAEPPARRYPLHHDRSQGEPLSALSRIAINDHRHVKIEKDDTVVFSARAIRATEKAIEQRDQPLGPAGADVVQEGARHVHVSGHGSEEELKLVLSLARPKYFVPIHGDYRQLSRHARVAERVTAGVDRGPRYCSRKTVTCCTSTSARQASSTKCRPAACS